MNFAIKEIAKISKFVDFPENQPLLAIMKHTKQLLKDTKIALLIEEFGELPLLTPTKDLFVDILESIVSQQLSVKASDTIWKRFKILFGKKKMTPRNLLTIDDEKIRSSGISYSKIKYMKGLATGIVNKEIDLEALTKLPNEEVLVELTRVKGIGPWTAEMILMFSLAREDVFSLGDIGLRNAIAKIYEIDRDDLKKVAKISNKWKPYRTYAARYLWKSLDNLPKPSKTLPEKSPQKGK